MGARHSTSSTPQYRPLGNALDRSRQFGSTSDLKIHELCSAKRRRTALSSHQEQHRRLTEYHRSARAPTWTQIHLRSSPNQSLRPRSRRVRLLLGLINTYKSVQLISIHGTCPWPQKSKKYPLRIITAKTLASLPAVVVPRLLRIQDAAKYLSATTWQIETLLRENVIPSFVLGKRRVVDRLELDRYVERRNAEAKDALLEKAG